ncbi:MAG: amidohydrolase family protein [bacterium]|nr:amidohydrolase family protein [bacterium]
MISTVLEGGTIVDGTGRPRFTTDVAIVGERVALVGDCADRDAVRRVDCRGKIVAPGFLDISSRSSREWLEHPVSSSKIGQGITTDIGGNCGDSRFFGWEEWRDADEFFALAARGTTAPNVASFVGLSDARAASDPFAAIRAACESGALGVSLDLDGAAHDDALEAMRAARAGGAPRASVHLGDDPSRIASDLEDAIALAARADVSLHVVHHHAAFAMHAGAVHRTLERIDRARTRGADVTCDVYPYVATWIALASLLPPVVTPNALQDPTIAATAALALQARLGERWHEIMLAEVRGEAHAAWCGSRIDEIASAWRSSPARALVTLVRDEPEARAFLFCMREDDVATALSAPFCAIGTAAPSFALDPNASFGGPHPRAFGAFARTIARFVRQKRSLDLEEAIRRMTSLPAAIAGIAERGTIAVDAYADLVVFEESAFVDAATYARPYALPLGLAAIFVNGEPLAPGERRARYPGHVLRGGHV